MGLPDEQSSYMEPSSPIGRTQLGLAASFVTPSKKNGGKSRPSCWWQTLHQREEAAKHNCCRRWFKQWSKSKKNGWKRQPSRQWQTIRWREEAIEHDSCYLHNGEHTLIPVKVKMIHSAVQDCKRFVLKDGWPLQVKLVGVVRNFRVHDKHVQIDLEDGTGLLRVIFWRKQKECTAQRHLIDERNSNHYIRVIGEVAVYYGVHEIIAFDIWPVSSGNEVTHHFLEVAYSYEKRLESVEIEMMKSVLLV